MKINYKQILITGASSGIGRAIANKLAAPGVHLFLCARTKEKLHDTAEACKKKGAQCTIFPFDISSTASIDSMIDSAVSELGSIDALINCSGIYPQDGIDNITPELWDSVMTVNLRNTFFLSRQVLSLMKRQRSGYIIFINSTVALGAKPSVTAYSVSKYGLSGAAAAMYEDARQYHVRVSSIYPGVTDTDTLRRDGMPCAPEQCMLPEDIAQCAEFLLSTSPRMIIKDIIPWACAYDKI